MQMFSLASAHLRAVVVAALVLALPAAASAQTYSEIPGTGYLRSVQQIPYSGCPGSLDELSTGTSGGDVGSYQRTLPFPFRFYGTDTTDIRISATGGVALGTGAPALGINNVALGGSGSPNGFIAPFWDNIEILDAANGHPNSRLRVSTTGTAPNREYCIEWFEVNHENTNPGLYTYKMVLHEGPTGQVDLHYGPNSGGTGSFNATTGMEDLSGGRPIDFFDTACSPSCTHTNYASMIDQLVTITAPVLDLSPAAVRAPAYIYSVAPQTVEVDVVSGSLQPLGPFEIALFAADNAQMVGAVQVGTGQGVTGGPGSSTIEVQARIPASFAPQTRVWLSAVVDAANVITEVTETNNARTSVDSSLILPGGPDLAVDRVSASTTAVSAGDVVQVSVRLRNLGSVAAPNAAVSVVLSTNLYVSGDDDRLVTRSVSLDPEGEATLELSAPVPATTRSGSYVLGVVADPARTVDEIDELNNSAIAVERLTVSGAQLAITTTRIPAATVGVGYTALVEATGGSGDYDFTVTGSLPSGFGIVAETGEIFGLPSMVGTSSFDVRVVDRSDSSLSAEQSFTLAVVETEQPLTVVNRTLEHAEVGSAYRAELIAAGGAAATADLSWSATGLPAELSLSTDGVLSGRFSETATHSFTVSVEDGAARAERTLTLEVREPGGLRIVAEPLPLAILGTAYTHQLNALGGIAPLAWQSGGQLETSGLSLEADGTITGVPSAVGSFNFRVQVRDAGAVGTALTDEMSFTLEVRSDDRLEIFTEALPVGRVGEGYDRSIAAIGGLPPYTWSLDAGELPDGISADEDRVNSELRIAGTPTEPSSTVLLVRVRDREGREAQAAFNLIIEAAGNADDGPGDDGCTAVTGSGSTAPLALLGLVLGFARRRRRR